MIPRGRRFRRNAAPVVAASVLVVALVSMVAGCASGPPEPTPEAAPRIVADTSGGAVVSDAPVPVALDPGDLSGWVRAVEVSIRTDGANDPTPVARWELEPTEETDGTRSLQIPLEGLVDGEAYTARFALLLTDGGRWEVDGSLPLRLSLGIPAPVPTPAELVTLDRRPEFAWSVPDAVGDRSGWRARVTYVVSGTESTIEADGGAGRVRPQSPVVELSAFAGRESLVWRVRLVSASGVLGPWSTDGTVRFDPAAAVPVALAHRNGLASVVATPGLSWNPVSGARRYRVEIGVTDDTAADGAAADGAAAGNRLPSADERLETRDPRVRLETPLLEELFVGRTGRTVVWRVMALGEDGVQTPFSPWYRFRYAPVVGGLEPVVPTGTSVMLTVGADDAPEADERPAALVAVTRPFEMMRYELTNDAVAALVAAEVDAGRMVVSDGAVRAAADPERVYLGLGELDFGRQIAFTVDGDSLAVRPGYGSHPAAGVTWFGAVALANALSRLEARQPVYGDAATTEDPAMDADLSHDGYRLPSEAEWATAVGLTGRLRGDDRVAVTEARPVSTPEIRGSNFLRSGDRWEDPLPPYTRNGGPTSPVGALGYATPVGMYDMIGNVWEWTADWYDPDWYGRIADGEVDATAAAAGPDAPVADVYGRTLRTVRGGAWNSPRETVRPGNRGGFAPGATSHSIGVRLVRTLR